MIIIWHPIHSISIIKTELRAAKRTKVVTRWCLATKSHPMSSRTGYQEHITSCFSTISKCQTHFSYTD